MVICQAAVQRIDGDVAEVVARVWPGEAATRRVRLTAHGQIAGDLWAKRATGLALADVAHAQAVQELAGCAWVALFMGGEVDAEGLPLAALFFLPGARELFTVWAEGIDLGARIVDKGHKVGAPPAGAIQPTPKEWGAA